MGHLIVRSSLTTTAGTETYHLARSSGSAVRTTRKHHQVSTVVKITLNLLNLLLYIYWGGGGAQHCWFSDVSHTSHYISLLRCGSRGVHGVWTPPPLANDVGFLTLGTALGPQLDPSPFPKILQPPLHTTSLLTAEALLLNLLYFNPKPNWSRPTRGRWCRSLKLNMQNPLRYSSGKRKLPLNDKANPRGTLYLLLTCFLVLIIMLIYCHTFWFSRGVLPED